MPLPAFEDSPVYEFCEVCNEMMPHNVIPKLLEGGRTPSTYYYNTKYKNLRPTMEGAKVLTFFVKPNKKNQTVKVYPRRFAKAFKWEFRRSDGQKDKTNWMPIQKWMRRKGIAFGGGKPKYGMNWTIRFK